MAACNVWLSRNNYYKCVRNRFELRGNDNEEQSVKDKNREDLACQKRQQHP